VNCDKLVAALAAAEAAAAATTCYNVDQPLCSTGEHLASSSKTSRGTCLACTTCNESQYQYRTGSCAGTSDSIVCHDQPRCPGDQALLGHSETVMGACKLTDAAVAAVCRAQAEETGQYETATTAIIVVNVVVALLLVRFSFAVLRKRENVAGNPDCECDDDLFGAILAATASSIVIMITLLDFETDWMQYAVNMESDRLEQYDDHEALRKTTLAFCIMGTVHLFCNLPITVMGIAACIFSDDDDDDDDGFALFSSLNNGFKTLENIAQIVTTSIYLANIKGCHTNDDGTTELKGLFDKESSERTSDEDLAIASMVFSVLGLIISCGSFIWDTRKVSDSFNL